MLLLCALAVYRCSAYDCSDHDSLRSVWTEDELLISELSGTTDRPPRVGQLSSGSWMLGNSAHHATAAAQDSEWNGTLAGLPPIGVRIGRPMGAEEALDEDIKQLLQSLEDD